FDGHTRIVVYIPEQSVFLSHYVCLVALFATVSAANSQSVPAHSCVRTNPESLSTYELGPEDQIVIRALHCEEISDKPFRIQPDGFINLPLVGQVKAGGLTVSALEIELQNRLKKCYVNPETTVTISEFRSQPVSVVGSVTNP